MNTTTITLNQLKEGPILDGHKEFVILFTVYSTVEGGPNIIIPVLHVGNEPIEQSQTNVEIVRGALYKLIDMVNML